MKLVWMHAALTFDLASLMPARALCLAAAALAACASASPNIVFILADDLDNRVDLLAHMPRLRQMREQGLAFTSHVAAQPVCGPSRSSMLAGRYPHNVGYIGNLDPASVAAYLQEQNNTVGTWLTAAGYHTAYMGKVREVLWAHWDGAQ